MTTIIQIDVIYIFVHLYIFDFMSILKWVIFVTISSISNR